MPEGCGDQARARRNVREGARFILLVQVANVDDLGVLAPRLREHQAVAILRFVEQDEVGVESRVGLFSDLQVNVGCDGCPAVRADAFFPVLHDMR